MIQGLLSGIAGVAGLNSLPGQSAISSTPYGGDTVVFDYQTPFTNKPNFVFQKDPTGDYIKIALILAGAFVGFYLLKKGK